MIGDGRNRGGAHSPSNVRRRNELSPPTRLGRASPNDAERRGTGAAEARQPLRSAGSRTVRGVDYAAAPDKEPGEREAPRIAQPPALHADVQLLLKARPPFRRGSGSMTFTHPRHAAARPHDGGHDGARSPAGRTQGSHAVAGRPGRAAGMTGGVVRPPAFGPWPRSPQVCGAAPDILLSFRHPERVGSPIGSVKEAAVEGVCAVSCRPADASRIAPAAGP